MNSETPKPLDRFKRSRRMVWTVLIGVFVLCGLAIWDADTNATPVLTTIGPTMLALVGAWTGVTNWAQVRNPDIGS